MNSKGLFSLSKSRSKSIDSEAEKSHGSLGLSLLYSPDNPQFDFVFVHGLGGHSRKTWCKSGDNYWPQDWLPKDAAFSHVRVHTYGYGSDYLKGKGDCLNIHHFGKAFLAALSTSPKLASSNTKIVAIGHSLGGLVIKKAYMLAAHDAIHKSLAGRFTAVFFLATPHRGADSAKLLRNILRVAYDRPYVGDLNPSSSAIQVINDEFRHVSENLELWSFYETQNMKHFGSLIVEPESALLGYREEKQVPMAADHRSICKFDDPSEPNYVLLRNALMSTVAARPQQESVETKRQDMRSLARYLEVADVLDDEFSQLCDIRQGSSCEWILQKEPFSQWRGDTSSSGHTVLWINGKPATGKSVLASFVIEHLRQSGNVCSFFFFKHSDKSKSTLHRCLRHWAYQMADVDEGCREALLQKRTDGISLEHMDERTIWRMMFQSGVLKALRKPHFFVIDALDECSNATVFFDTVLPNLDPSVPVKILVVSRDAAYIQQGFVSSSNKPVIGLPISEDDTLPDLRSVVQNNIQSLGAVQGDNRHSLVEDILAKSKGSFLWTILVLRELSTCHTLRDINQVLADVPKGMEALYRRILSQMESAPRGKLLAKAILLWTTCAIRPMSVEELNGALQIDIKDTFPQLRESISALCGYLVTIDKSGRVQMIHETAREFLLGNDLNSEFAVNSQEAHTHMAKICLLYLTSDEMKPPRITRRRNCGGATLRDPFATYTYYAYSYHLSKADASSMELLELVETFLKSNVLTWIEAIAGNRTLKQLIRSSNHIRAYVNACTIEHSPVNKRIQNLQQWPRDLARATAMFSTALIASPPAIYSIIPPLCPSKSRLHHTTGASRRLKILGCVSDQWDDRLLGIDFRRGQPTAMCYGEEFLAIGLSTGAVSLYHLASYQEYRIFQHGESVSFIEFKKRSPFLATCGLKSVKVWNLRTGEMLHSFQSPPRPLDLQFQENMLMVASHRNYIVSWEIDELLEPQRIEKSWIDSDDGSQKFGTARAMAFSEPHKMLAVAYTGRPITVWDTDEASIIGTCGKKDPDGETSKHPVTSLVFNPNPSVPLLAATYLDGNLALLDPLEDEQLECFRANCQALAASPNGRLLAAGGADGIIHVFEFDTLKLLYKVKSQNSFIKSLCFAKDSFVLADIRGARCTVWEPEAILRDSLGDDSSGITSNSTVEITSVDSTAIITVIATPDSTDAIFCGKDDGSVGLYSTATAVCVQVLYRHNVAVRHLLSWTFKDGLRLLSVDVANRIFLYTIKLQSNDQMAIVDMVFQAHLEAVGAISELLVSQSMGKLLASTQNSDHLFDLQSGLESPTRPAATTASTSSIRKWAHHPTDEACILCFGSGVIKVHSWDDLTEFQSKTFELNNKPTELARLKQATNYRVGEAKGLLVVLSSGAQDTLNIGILEKENEIRKLCKNYTLQPAAIHGKKDSSSKSTLGDVVKAWDNLSITEREETVVTLDGIVIENFEASHIIGVNDAGFLVFLDRNSWVCSCDLRGVAEAIAQAPQAATPLSATRHFFIPHNWFAGRREMIGAVLRKDLILVRGGELAIVRGYMEHES